MNALLTSVLIVVGAVVWRLARRNAIRSVDANCMKPVDIAAALEACSRSLRTGSSLRNAIRASSLPIAPALAEGHPLGVVLDGWAQLATDPAERMAATAVALAAATGGPQARAIDAASVAVRDRIAATDEIAAHSSQARLSATVISCLPVVFVAWTLLADRRTAATLIGTPIGWLCLVVGLGLDALGLAWVRSLVRRAL